MQNEKRKTAHLKDGRREKGENRNGKGRMKQSSGTVLCGERDALCNVCTTLLCGKHCKRESVITEELTFKSFVIIASESRVFAANFSLDKNCKSPGEFHFGRVLCLSLSSKTIPIPFRKERTNEREREDRRNRRRFPSIAHAHF